MPFRLAMASNSSASNTGEISSESKETALMIGIVNLLVGIIAVVGNSALCLTVYQDPFRRLRSTANYLVVNLAIADLLTGLITEPLYAAYEIINQLHRKRGVYPVHYRRIDCLRFCKRFYLVYSIVGLG